MAMRDAWVALLDTLIDGQARILAWVDGLVARQVRKDMNSVREDLMARAAVAATATKKARLEEAIASASRLHGEALAMGVRTTKRAQREAAELSERAIQRAIAAASEEGAGVAWEFPEKLSPAQLRQAADQPFFGWDVSRWSEFYEIEDAQKIDRTLRAGWLAGDSIEDMTEALMAVTDGRADDMERLARTSIMTSSNRAAEEVYKANADVLSGMRWVATLDNTTCPQCGALDGTIIDLKDPAIQPPPAHHNCRCFLAPEVKADLLPGIELTPSPTWTDWITGSYGRLSEDALRERQEAVLGPTIAGLLSSGRISPADLITESGRRRTVEEISTRARRAA